MSEERPLPLPDELTTPFWQATNEHRLAIQRCCKCRRWNHAPTSMCPSCGSAELEFEPVSGRATLYSWTVIHDPPAPGFVTMLPLIVGLVELEEQEKLVLACNLVGADPELLRIGLPLEVAFADVASDITLPEFRPVRS